MVTPVKINMMCGKRNFGPDWYHVDGADYPHITDKDIMLGSFPDNSVDLLFCSHGIAYFSRTEIIPILKAWHRVLKVGGVLRLATPDMKVISMLYKANIELDKLLGPMYGAMIMADKTIYHKTIYDYNSLDNLLRGVGFDWAPPYEHTKTEHANTGDRNDKYDDHSAAYICGTLISLNVECLKIK